MFYTIPSKYFFLKCFSKSSIVMNFLFLSYATSLKTIWILILVICLSFFFKSQELLILYIIWMTGNPLNFPTFVTRKIDSNDRYRYFSRKRRKSINWNAFRKSWLFLWICKLLICKQMYVLNCQNMIDCHRRTMLKIKI